MDSLVKHRGTIVKTSPTHVTVSITPTAAECNGCAISSLCTKGEMVDVQIDTNQKLNIGQQVTIGAPVGLQRGATLLLFVIPVVLIIAVLAIALSLDMSELAATMISISSVVVWYALLYAFRIKIRKKVQFRIIN